MMRSNRVVVAHRGRCGDLPENAIESLDLLPPWIRATEIDVRLTRDGVPVLMHDETIDRTTCGSGEVADLPLGDIISLERPDGASVPLLEDYLRRSAARIDLVLVDIKAGGAEPGSATVRAATAADAAHRCVFLVRETADLIAMRQMGHELRLGLFGARLENIDCYIQGARRSSAEIMFVRHGDDAYLANRAIVPRILADGLRPGASTINRPEVIDAAMTDGCELILTDVGHELEGVGEGSAGD